VKHHSHAGVNSGQEDPEEIEFYTVEDNECPLDQCIDCGADHYVLQWHGNEYDRERTWMTADEKDVLDLEEHR
jgi:hypothetical protein